MKRSVNEDQKLDLNRIDFERAGSGRKAGYKFTIEFFKGTVANVISGSPLAPDLATVMLGDPVVKGLFQNNDYIISLNTKFQLSIQCIANVRTSKPQEELTVSDSHNQAN